jgi:MoaA/NifB/PqqE/SkfB family radical SAM enzyme
LTLLTAGLLLARDAAMVAEYMDDVIVSLDGPASVHDAIRAVPGAYRRLEEGIDALRRLRHDAPVHARCTVQKANVSELRATLGAARRLGLNSVSFLAADLTSEAFNRPGGWSGERQAAIAPDASEVAALEREVAALIDECAGEIESGFVVERPEKLRRIPLHFRAHLGRAEAVAPRCNAPWVSAVVESDGAVRPCFFHPVIGNIHRQPLVDVLNGEEAMEFRRRLDVSRNPVCRNCVCSLFVEESKAP